MMDSLVMLLSLYAALQQPMHLHGFAMAFDAPRQRAYLGHVGGVFALNLAELRRELARLGLDWPDEHPGARFVKP